MRGKIESMKNTAEQTKYRVETDGETPCLSGHGIIEVDAIDDTHAIVTVEGNGVMFEQHAATCDAIFGIEQIPRWLQRLQPHYV